MIYPMIVFLNVLEIFERQKSRCRDEDLEKRKSSLSFTTEKKRQFIRDNLEKFGSVSKGCKIMDIPISTYYHRPYESSKKHSDFEVRDLIEKIHQEFPAYGYRRVYHHLLRSKIRINSKRLKCIMREFELYTCLKKWMRARGTHSGLKLRYPNLIVGKKITGPNQI